MKFTLLCLITTLYLFISSALTGALIQWLMRQRISFAVRLGLGYSIFDFLLPLAFTSIISHRMVAYLHVLLMLCLICYFIKNKIRFLQTTDLSPLTILSLFLISYLFFMIPAWSVPDGGTFTAGGGDITIYSTLANHIPDDSLMSRNNWHNLYKFLSSGVLPQETQASPGPLYAGNAPYPNWSGYRMNYHVGPSFYMHGWIMPMGYLTHIYPGLNIATIYFGVLGFLYSLLLIMFAEFAWTKSKQLTTTLLCFFLPLASYGFVYAAYNHYYPTFASIFYLLSFLFFLMSSRHLMGIVTLAALLMTCILLQNWPVTPFYVLAMLLALILVKRRQLLHWKVLGTKLFFAFSMLTILLAAPMIQIALSRLLSFISMGAASAMSIDYLGLPRAFFSWSLVQASLGYLQLTNLPPYTIVEFASSFFAHGLCIIGIVSVLVLISQIVKAKYPRYLFAIFILIYCLSYFAGSGTEYTQFKGISYSLPLFFAMLVSLISQSANKKWVSIPAWLFAGSLLFFHVIFMKGFIQQQVPTSVVSINLPNYLEKADPLNQSVFIIYPPSPQAIYTLDSIISNRKYFFAREFSYADLNSGSTANILDAYGIEHFKVVSALDSKNWQIEPLLSRLDKNHFEVFGARYEKGSGTNIEIIFAPMQKVTLFVYKKSNENMDVLLWNKVSKNYKKMFASKMDEKKSVYILFTSKQWGAIRIPGESKIEIKVVMTDVI